MNTLSLAALSITYLYVVGFLTFMYFSSGRGRDRNILLWISANVLTLISFAVFMLNEWRHGPWIVLQRNILLAIASVNVVYVLLNVARRRPATWLLAVALAAFVSLNVYFTLISYDTLLRIVVMDFFTILFSGYSIYELLAAHREEHNGNYLLLVAAFVFMIVAYLYRTLYTFGAANLDTPLNVEEIRRHVFLVSLLANSAFLLLWNVVLYVLLSQRGEAA
jgi:hypothetical protein